MDFLYSEGVEKYLDSGMGDCYLCQKPVAEIIENALLSFDKDRYLLHTWCIMPNHVHAIIKPLAPHELAKIIHSLKSFTAKEANKLLNRTGPFWQSEYFDHIIRSEEEYSQWAEYTIKNPERAGFDNWPWMRHKGSAIKDG